MDLDRSLPLLRHMSPNGAVALATFGVLLVFFELNRPGRIWAGSLGLLLFLLAAAALLGMELRSWAVWTLASAAGIFLLNLYRRLPVPLLVLATLACIVGLRCLLPPEAIVPVTFHVALAAGTVLGASSAALTRIAYRARRAKALD